MLYVAKNLLERDVMGLLQVFTIVDTEKLASQMHENLSNTAFERSEVAGALNTSSSTSRREPARGRAKNLFGKRG